MDEAELRRNLEDGEALRFQTELREGGQLGITDERILVAADENHAVSLSQVREITTEHIDWFMVVLSVALGAVAYYTGRQRPLLGVAFFAVALGNLYWTYRKRGAMKIHVHGRAKPIEIHVDRTEVVTAALDRALEPHREESPPAELSENS